MRKTAVLVFILVILSTAAVATPRHQVGAAASGRAARNGAALVSVLGQPVGGTGGEMNSGFLPPLWQPQYLPGDANGDGGLSIADAVFLINYIFAGGSAPYNLLAADADCSRSVSIADAVFLINYIFGGGPKPVSC